MNELKYFWAKKNCSENNLLWLPLVTHLEDTQKVSLFLWNHYLSDSQRKVILNSLIFNQKTNSNHSLMDDEGAKLVSFLGAAHDLGKATPAFQLYKPSTFCKELDEIIKERLNKTGYVTESHLSFPEKSNHALAGYYLAFKFGLDKSIGEIIDYHHGKSSDFESFESQSAYNSNYYGAENSNHSCCNRWKSAQEKLFNWSVCSSGYKNVMEIPKIKLEGQVLLSGLLIMADWIASNNNYFPLISIDQLDLPFSYERIQKGIEKWFKVIKWIPETVLDVVSEFYKRFSFYPNGFQTKIIQEIEQCKDNVGLIIIEGPMGIGKTELSLFLAERLAEKKGMNGVFLGLPTQATANGIFDRYKKWLEKLKNDYNKTFQIRLVHGNAYLNDSFSDLIFDKTSDIKVNQWFSSRKTTVLDDFIVGTVDQFLLMALKQKHVALKHLGFSKKVVIIDEVHAFDAYMGQYLEAAIMWLGLYHVPVIILSATLEENSRRKLCRAYLKGLCDKLDKVEKKRFLKFEIQSNYPQATYINNFLVNELGSIEALDKKTVQVLCSSVITHDEITDYLVQLEIEEGIVGVVVNTVKKAQDIAKNLMSIYSAEDVQLIHSSMISKLRIEKENRILNDIGKNGERPYFKIIIGTQVLEQSLDIDFDILLTELAPIDLLIQRIGRLHRHSRTRPIKLKNPQVHILGKAEIKTCMNCDEIDSIKLDEGSKYIYGEYLLINTLLHLPDKLVIPDDISKLVNNVYSKNMLLSRLYDRYQAVLKAKEKRADTYKLVPENTSTIQEISDNTLPLDYDEFALAKVRDTDENIEVIALKRINSGYGIFGYQDNCDLSDSISDVGISKLIIQNTLRIKNIFFSQDLKDRFIKDLEQYNIEFLPNWQDNVFLKGSLGIIFEENNGKFEFEICGFKLIYHEVFGLTIEKVRVD